MARHIPTKYPRRAAQAQQERIDTAAIYVRVSTEDQASEGYSLDAQRRKLEGQCAAKGWTIDEAHTYIDAGFSAKTTDRPALQRMIAAAAAGEFTRLLVVKLDRLTRSVPDAYALVNQLREHGVSFLSIEENFDLATPTGEAMFGLMAVFAQWERRAIADRMAAGKMEKARQGGYNGSPAPQGYTYMGEGRFEVDRAGAAVVRGIFADFVKGATLSAIADRLNRDGIPTASGDGRWYASTVRHILKNGAYAGLIEWKPKGDAIIGIEGVYPAIIERQTFDAALARLQGLRRGPARLS